MAESNEQVTKATEVNKAEDDMDSLLDSALDDFSKVSLAETTKSPSETTEENDSASAEGEDPLAQLFKGAFADPNIAKMFEEGDLAESFQKIADAATKAMEGDSSSFADIMADALKNLQDNSESTRYQFEDPEQMANVLQEMGMNGDMTGQSPNLEDLPPFIRQMMQQFISKDVLYPPIKDFVERYPPWLERNKDVLSQEDYDNYVKQLELMRKVVEEFEAETDADSEEVKSQRFARIMDLMQQMQALGQPPAELIQGDSVLDESALPNLPPGMDPQQCRLM